MRCYPHYCLVFSTELHTFSRNDPEHNDFLTTLSEELTRLKQDISGATSFHFARLIRPGGGNPHHHHSCVTWDAEIADVIDINLQLRGRQSKKVDKLSYVFRISVIDFF